MGAQKTKVGGGRGVGRGVVRGRETVKKKEGWKRREMEEGDRERWVVGENEGVSLHLQLTLVCSWRSASPRMTRYMTDVHVTCFIWLVLGFHKIGGYTNLQKRYMEAIPSLRNPNSTCGFPRSDAFHIFRDAETGDNPWPGLILQSSLGCMWYWCCDQVTWQLLKRLISVKENRKEVVCQYLPPIVQVYSLVFRS